MIPSESTERWYVGAQNDVLYVIDQPPRPSTDDINPDREVGVIARVYQSPDEDRRARVLAAAPELLAACKRVDEIQRRGTAFYGEWREVTTALRAAIAKAEKGGGE